MSRAEEQRQLAVRRIETALREQRRVQVMVPRSGVKAMRKAIRDYFGGAWPINVKLVEVETSDGQPDFPRPA